MPGTKAEAKPKATVIIDAGFAKICRNWGQAGAKWNKDNSSYFVEAVTYAYQNLIEEDRISINEAKRHCTYYRWNSQDGDFELKQGYEYNGEGKYNTPPKGTSTAQDPAKAAAARLKKLWLLFMVGLGRSMAEFLEEAKTACKLVRADAENAKSKAATEGSGNGEEDEESVIEEEIESVEEGEMEEEETKHSPSPRRGTVVRKR
jgi:hypothetical protein